METQEQFTVLRRSDRVLKNKGVSSNFQKPKTSFLTKVPLIVAFTPAHFFIPRICHHWPHISAISSEKQLRWSGRRKHECKHRLFTVWTLFRLCCWFSTRDRVQATAPHPADHKSPMREQNCTYMSMYTWVSMQTDLSVKVFVVCVFWVKHMWFGWNDPLRKHNSFLCNSCDLRTFPWCSGPAHKHLMDSQLICLLIFLNYTLQAPRGQ